LRGTKRRPRFYPRARGSLRWKVRTALKATDTAVIQTIVTAAKADRLKAQEFTAQASALFEKSNKALGLAEGQNQRTENTGLFYAAQTRDTLLGRENELETFGFKVVVGSAASPVRKAKATA